jgi:hypothetical protein
MTGTQLERNDMTTKGFFAGRWWLVLVGLIIGGILGLADYAASGSVVRAIIDVAIVTGYSSIVAIFRSRSETASVLAGSPVDERWQVINMHALAAAGLVGAVVALGGFVLAQASGHDWSGFAIVAVAIGISYLGGVFWYRSRI